MPNLRVLSVGQCSFDHGNLAAALRRTFQAETVGVDTAEAAFGLLKQEAFACTLVNRLLDANGESGLEFIRRLRAAPELRSHPVMLVSNYPEAQQQAIALGAAPGFGKNDLGSAAMAAALRPFLAPAGVSA